MKKFYCQDCNHQVPLEAVFCPNCKKQFDSVLCPKCEYSGSSNMFHNGCPKCGYLKREDSIKKRDKPLPLFKFIIIFSLLTSILTLLLHNF